MHDRIQACVSGKSKRWVFRGPACAPRGARPVPALLLALSGLALAGCSSLSGAMSSLSGPREIPPAQVEAPPPRPADPLSAFVASAQPGQQGVVSPEAGLAPVPVRVVRAYNAGSGRECRELSIGGGGVTGGRPALYCQGPAGWEAARPLLRGGAVARP
ncbi:putative small lipoprotein YifL [Pseudoroseomonas cervicalis]|nr:putative small lipoprotein YifL [Pseudoroseomonas cervicalis]